MDIFPLHTLRAQTTQWAPLPQYQSVSIQDVNFQAKLPLAEPNPPNPTANHSASSSKASHREQYRLELKFCMKSQSNYNQKELEEIWYEILEFPWDKIVLQGPSWLMSLY